MSVYFDERLVESYRERILSEVECLFEDGFGQTTGAQSNVHGRVRHRPDSSAVPPIMASEQTVEELPTIELSSETSSEQVDAQEEREEPDPRIEHDWDCMTECLLSASNGSLFDEKRFLEIANAMLDRVVNNNDLNKKETMKSRVVSLLLKRLATMLSLTKSQTNVLVRFFKDALVLISPESENMARNIRASYDSCRRQSMKDEEKSNGILKRIMRDCGFFFNRCRYRVVWERASTLLFRSLFSRQSNDPASHILRNMFCVVRK